MLKEKNEENQNLQTLLETLKIYLVNEENQTPKRKKKTKTKKVGRKVTYIENESDGDTYLKQLALEKYLKKMRKHFIDIIEELKCIIKVFFMENVFHVRIIL